MTLTNRLLAFLLLSHAVLLAGFSVAVYAVARAQLFRQLDESTDAALDTLAASAEQEPDGWEWEPHERRRGRGAADMPAWAVYGESGRRIDGAGEPSALLEQYRDPSATAERSRFRAQSGGERWRVARRILIHPHPEEPAAPIDGEKPRYRTLVFVAAAPQDPVESMLATLAGSLAAGSAAALALVGVGGRWWCRRALAPVAAMTAAVKGIGTASLAERVPVPAPRDGLRELAEAFNALLARVQVGYERQARFTAEASHQLRTPLAGMLGQLELALKRERDPEEYRRAIAVAARGAGHLNGIIEMLLFLARADGEAPVADLEPAVLAEVVAGHLDEHWSSHPRRGDISLEAVGGSSVRTHTALLGQALHNVLENAIKYSEPGTPIAIRIDPSDGGVELSIRDGGCGIAADELGRVFEPFYRTAGASGSPIRGSGLGLAVARRIVLHLGATVRLASDLGRGTTVTIRLAGSPIGAG